MKKLSSPIRVVCIAVAAALAVVGAAQAQPVTQAKVLDLLAQAQVGVTGAAAPQAGQPATTAPSQVIDLTQEDAVAKALKMNIDLSVERLNPQLQDLALKGAFAAYVPTVGATLGERSNTTRPGNIYSGGDVARVNTMTTTVQLQREPGHQVDRRDGNRQLWQLAAEYRQLADHPHSALRQQPAAVVCSTAVAQPGD